MARRVPDARARLEAAAVHLYAERGHDGVTATDIAQRAGVTERTLFRHFAQKTDVLFAEEDRLRAHVADLVGEAPAELTAAAALEHALLQYSTHFTERAALFRERATVIASIPELRRRELATTHDWVEAITRALVARGADEHAGRLLGFAGLGVFRVAYETWTAASGTEPLAAHITRAAGLLRHLLADETSTSRSAAPGHAPDRR